MTVVRVLFFLIQVHIDIMCPSAPCSGAQQGTTLPATFPAGVEGWWGQEEPTHCGRRCSKVIPQGPPPPGVRARGCSPPTANRADLVTSRILWKQQSITSKARSSKTLSWISCSRESRPPCSENTQAALWNLQNEEGSPSVYSQLSEPSYKHQVELSENQNLSQHLDNNPMRDPEPVPPSETAPKFLTYKNCVR